MTSLSKRATLSIWTARRILPIAAILAALLLLTPTLAATAWSNIDPPVVTSPANDNFGFNSVVTVGDAVYVGTNHQGIWKSTTLGTVWVKINIGVGGQQVGSGIQWSMAADPFNPLVLYTTSARGAQGVWKSVDGGVSWTQLLAGDSPTARQIGTNDVYTVSTDPFTPNHVLLSFHYFWNNSNSGVLESLDGGQSWIVHNPAGSWGAGNGVWFGNNSDTWIVGSQNAGLWITMNRGSSWRQFSTTSITHGGTQALYRDPATGTLVIAASTTILRSTDSGATWENISQGLTYSYYETVVSDGVNMYTAPSFPINGDFGAAHGPWLTRSLLGSSPWVANGTQTPCSPAGYCNGPVMGSYAPATSSLYAVNWNGGVWRMQMGSAPPPTSTPILTSTATLVPAATATSTSEPVATSTATAAPSATPTLTAVPSPATCQVQALVNGTPTLFSRPSSFCTDQ